MQINNMGRPGLVAKRPPKTDVSKPVFFSRFLLTEKCVQVVQDEEIPIPLESVNVKVLNCSVYFSFFVL